jgi:NADPH2:quinone reductase
MHAIVVHSLGSPEVLVWRAHPNPRPGPEQVLVRLHAIGVNFADTERRRGLYQRVDLPWIPGDEAAGVVEGLGPGVPARWLGRRVAFWSPARSGSYAEYAVAPLDCLFELVDGIDFVTGAALPVQGLTAYGLAYRATALPAGTTALVHAAAGGVGALLVQLLRRRGVRVLGTASSPRKQTLVRQLGAEPVEYGAGLADRVRDATDGRGVDAVFDSVGRPTQAASLASLAPYGRLIFFGEAGGAPGPIDPDALYQGNLSVAAWLLPADPPDSWETARRELQEWIVAGSLRVIIGQKFPLAQAAEAHRGLEARTSHGKLILLPPGATGSEASPVP